MDSDVQAGIPAGTDRYIKIMELSLSAYGERDIDGYIARVGSGGLTEHGFPRLGANIGILNSMGIRTDLRDRFLRIMDICTLSMPRVSAANDFSVREICACILACEAAGTVSRSLIAAWKERLRDFDPVTRYDVVVRTPEDCPNNWAVFGALSELWRGKCCGVRDDAFIDRQIASQFRRFDAHGMYRDPHEPVQYDMMTRALLACLLLDGYDGRYASVLREKVLEAAELTAKLQSVTGEMPFGGRSNQMYLNEPVSCAYFEAAASLLSAEGRKYDAGRMRGAAELASEYTLKRLSDAAPSELTHVKNRYPRESGIGCEKYAYFDKYMITAASNAYLAFSHADSGTEPLPAYATDGGFAVETGPHFHKAAVNCGGYFAEFDTDADPHYDATGLGRLQKSGCTPCVCLSVPFPPEPRYRTELPNPGPMAICPAIDGKPAAACPMRLISKEEADVGRGITLRFERDMPDGATVYEEYRIGSDGLLMKAASRSGRISIMIPVLEFDGGSCAAVTAGDGFIRTEFEGSVCEYSFDGELSPEYTYYCNRNGRYRVYEMRGDALKVRIERTGAERS
ncbi:MAG: hypothetical protein II534_03150 [Clostridia bacterium]|nr:hypothetical protein [Clostridia bacterium]